MKRRNNKNQSDNIVNSENPQVKKRRRKLDDSKIQEQIDKSIKIVNEYSRINDEIRKKRIGKTPQEYKEEIRQADFKRNLYSKIIFGVFAIFILIISILLINYSSIIGISLNKQISLDDSNKIDIVTGVDDVYQAYQDEILVYNNQKIYTYNKNGKITWEYTLEDKFTPSIFIKDRYLAISNNMTGVVYFFDNKKETYNKKIDGEIENVFIDSRGNAAIEYSTSGYKKMIGVYNKSGNHLYNVYLSFTSIIGIELINNASKMIVISANTSSFNVGVDISTIDIYTDESTPKLIASIDNRLVYDYLVRNNEIRLLLDNSIVNVNLTNGNQTVIKEFDSNQMLYITLNDTYYSCVEKQNNNENIYLQENYSNSNKLIGSAKVENSPKMFKNIDLVNYLLHQNSIEIFNKWGIKIKDITISYPPKDIIPFRNGKSVALIYTNKIYIVNI